MKRFIIAGMVGVLAVVGSTACQPPPEGYRAPVVDSVTQVSPQPARPGEEVTFVLEVHDDVIISQGFARELVGPTGAKLPGPRTCTASVELVGSLTHGSVTVTCPVPAFASNGTWYTDVTVFDRPAASSPEVSYPGTSRRLSFEVTGGSEDRSAPQFVSHQTVPAVIGQRTPFTLTVRVRDDTAPVALQWANRYVFRKLFATNSVFGCVDPVYAPVSATVTDITLSCTPGYAADPSPLPELGQHGVSLPVTDPLGQTRSMDVFIQVVPQP
jgi:hypothetical protein